MGRCFFAKSLLIIFLVTTNTSAISPVGKCASGIAARWYYNPVLSSQQNSDRVSGFSRAQEEKLNIIKADTQSEVEILKLIHGGYEYVEVADLTQTGGSNAPGRIINTTNEQGKLLYVIILNGRGKVEVPLSSVKRISNRPFPEKIIF